MNDIDTLTLDQLEELYKKIAQRVSHIKAFCVHEANLYRSGRDIKSAWPYSRSTCKKCKSPLGYICTGNPASPDGICKYADDLVNSTLTDTVGHNKYFTSDTVKLLDGSHFKLPAPIEYQEYDCDPCCIFCHNPADPPQ